MKIKTHLALGRKVMNNLDSILKSRDITLPTKVHVVKAMIFPVVMYGCENWALSVDRCCLQALQFSVPLIDLWIRMKRHHFANESLIRQSYGFFSSHVWMWELDHKKGWVLKIRRFRTVVPEKTLESPLDSKEIKPVNSKGNEHWIFIGRIDAEVEAAILWPPDAKNWLISKKSHAGKDWRQEDKGTIEDEMIRWHYRHNGHEFEQIREIVKDREAWWIAVHEVTKTQTQLKWLNNKHIKSIGKGWVL